MLLKLVKKNAHVHVCDRFSHICTYLSYAHLDRNRQRCRLIFSFGPRCPGARTIR